MRSILFLSTVIFTAWTQSACAADGKPVDGRWIWTLEVGGNTIHSALVLNTDGKKLTGNYKDENVAAEIKNGGFDDLNVWFDMDVELNGAEIAIEFSGEYDADSIEGTIEASINGGEESGEFEWNAKRETRPEDIAGQWQMEFDAPDGVTYRPKLTIKNESGKLSGSITNENGEVTLDAIKLKDHSFSFAFTTDYQGNDLDLVYECMPRGNKLSGTIQFSVDGNEGTIDLAGKKVVVDKQLLALVGSWKCSTVGPDGVERQPVLTTMVKDGKLTGRLKSEEIDVNIEEIKLVDGQAVFPFTNSHDGQTVALVWKCKAEGDKLVGTIEFNFGGETGEIDVEGKRQAD